LHLICLPPILSITYQATVLPIAGTRLTKPANESPLSARSLCAASGYY